jgi:diguanylate cyclase (GGDEF)-like protein
LVANLHDVTARKDAEQRLAHQAFHDPLTGLANRALLHDRLTQALRGPRGAGGVGVLFLDLDRFKLVNDSLGHPAGDELLRVAADRLSRVARPDDLVARLGGDEFALVVTGPCVELGTLGALAQRCIDALRQPLDLWGTPVLFGASVGVAVAGPGATSAQELLRHADIAMYVAKGRGRNGWALFDASMQSATLERLRLEADLRRALDEGQLELAYQPVVELATGELAGFEALVRWPHPTLGRLQPHRFIGIAEETGMIDELGGWVLREACADAAAWQLARPDDRPLQLSVNVSGRQVLGSELVTQVAAALLRSGLDPSQLVLELTESVLVGDTPSTAEHLGQLRALGARLAVDDFGTGYASMEQLARLPFAVIKVDRSLIAAVDTDPRAESVVTGVTDLARRLGALTVAEGVERAEQLPPLRAMGCQMAQGFHFAPALPAEELESLVAASSFSAPAFVRQVPRTVTS